MNNEEKLIKMLKYVSEHNDFYKNRIKEYGITNPLDITQWPILTRKELQENRYNMFSDGYKTKYFNQQLRRQSSSGSTGVPINVYWDYKDWYASNMCLWRRRQQWYGIRPSDKYCIFTLNAFGIIPEEKTLYYINKPSNVMSFNVSLIRDEHGYQQMAKVINNFRPQWLYIQPFVLNQLIRAYSKLNLAPVNTIRYIESVGEILTSDLRRRAEDMFGIKLTNMYGSEEMNGIAIENRERAMEVALDNVFLEVQNGDCIAYDEGNAIVTNLCNFAMPIIRYEQRDHIVLQRNDNNSMYLSVVLGRSHDDVELLSGVHINTFVLSELIAEINNQFNDIIVEYSFEYLTNERTLSCKISISDSRKEWTNNVCRAIKSAFNNKISKKSEITITVISEYENILHEKKKMFFVRL